MCVEKRCVGSSTPGSTLSQKELVVDTSRRKRDKEGKTGAVLQGRVETEKKGVREGRGEKEINDRGAESDR